MYGSDRPSISKKAIASLLKIWFTTKTQRTQRR